MAEKTDANPLGDELPRLPLTGTGGDKPTSIGIHHDLIKRLVVMRFPEPKLWVAMDPPGAMNIGDALKAEAEFIAYGKSRREILDGAANRLRDVLITRVTLMLTSMERDNKKPAYQAGAIVDQVLSTVSELANR